MSALFPGKVIKPLRLVDYNNKKFCQLMVELNLAPAVGIPEKTLNETVFQVTWENGETAFYQLASLYRCNLGDVTEIITFPSHGKDFYDFYQWFKQQHPTSDAETKMAVYYYKKLATA